jgi:hypothetical protein
MKELKIAYSVLFFIMFFVSCSQTSQNNTPDLVKIEIIEDSVTTDIIFETSDDIPQSDNEISKPDQSSESALEILSDTDAEVSAIPCTGDQECKDYYKEWGQCETVYCNLADGICAKTFLENGTVCEEGNPCTISDFCENGVCIGKNNKCPCSADSECDKYDDNDKCNGMFKCFEKGCYYYPDPVICDTTSDTECHKTLCDKISGKCKVELSEPGTICDDGNKCSLNDQCEGWICVGSSYESCNDSEECTDDKCIPETGECVHTNLEGACSDADKCTSGDKCENGKCVSGTEKIVCNDDNDCTEDHCEPADGCVYDKKQDDTQCDDGFSCTINDVCVNGKCKGTLTQCECKSDADCEKYDDQDKCNGIYKCEQDLCIFNPETVQCDPSQDTQCGKNTCMKETGECEIAYLPIGTQCDDNNKCTSNDSCLYGECTGIDLSDDCKDTNICTDDSCNPLTGCEFIPNSIDCDDGNKCTTDDKCSDKECKGNPVDCNDDKECTDDACDIDDGECKHQNNEKSCEDGNKCTVGDKCNAGICGSGTEKLFCDDFNDCTYDDCNPGEGCVHMNLSDISCDDKDLCTDNDYCENGQCKSGTKKICNDENTCTEDVCVSSTGKCDYQPKQGLCNDNNPCTDNDYCLGAVCTGITKTCSDQNDCTTDYCDPEGICQHIKLTGETCSDGDPCTTFDACDNGNCIPNGVLNCNDQNDCTKDECIKGKGCEWTLLEGDKCDDGNPCTDDDECSKEGECEGKLNLCDDLKPCTSDLCVNGSCTNTNTCPSVNPACTVNGCRCGSNLCDPNMNNVCDNGVCKCGSAVCNTVLSNKCENNTCKCGSSGSCNSTLSNQCVNGVCKCGAEPVCSGDNVICCSSGQCKKKWDC